MEQSGVHSAILGAVLGLLTPALPFFESASIPNAISRLSIAITPEVVYEAGRESLLCQLEDVASGSQTPLDRLERAAHPWANYLVLPVFGLANAGVVLSGDILREAAGSSISQDIVVGLMASKTIGIFGGSYIACRLKLCDLPAEFGWRQVAGLGLLGGIGFTVSLFIASQAFPQPGLLDNAKVGILVGLVCRCGGLRLPSFHVLEGRRGRIELMFSSSLFL